VKVVVTEMLKETTGRVVTKSETIAGEIATTIVTTTTAVAEVTKTTETTIGEGAETIVEGALHTKRHLID